MNQLQKIKKALEVERKTNLNNKSEIAYKLLDLFDHYKQNMDTKAIAKLSFIVETYTNISKDGSAIEFKMPNHIEDKIKKLYEKKLNTHKFGVKSPEKCLDELIDEADSWH